MVDSLELTGVVLALLYVVLAIKAHRSCWVAAGLSAGVYAVVFWRVDLMMEAALQLFYIAMSVYGWRSWGADNSEAALPIQRWPWRNHIMTLSFVAAGAWLIGGLMSNYTSAAMPFIDTGTTLAALVTTWMVARKILANWLYWIAIDAVSIYLYLSRGLDLTAALFGAYIVLAAAGYWQWQKHFAHQQTKTAS